MGERVGSMSGGRGWHRWRIASAVLLAAVMLGIWASAPSSAAEEPSIQPNVVGGTAVPDGKYPFVVAVLDKRYGSTADQQQFCGATLIDPDSVLTAAHCVRGNAASNLRVTVGRTVLSSTQGQVRNVLRINTHSSYNPNLNQSYDAAVLKLSSPVTGVRPIKLATASQDALESPGRYARVAGWGNTVAQPVSGSNGTSYPDRMREASVPVVSDTSARRTYGSRFVPSLMVAAGSTGKDTCQGDSGGPLFSYVSGSGYTQIGITSFGAGCGAAGYPGVYTEVNTSSVRSFITYWAAR